MCGGFEYRVKESDKTKKVFFPIPHVLIPYISDGQIAMAQWGKRKGEDEEFDVPQTGWARLESLAAHKWDKYNPSRVRVPALSFMEKDASRQPHWFNMEPNKFLLGVKIQKQDRSFIYIVTKAASESFRVIHDREPLMVGP